MTNFLRIAILEDEWVARSYLSELVTLSGLGRIVGAFEFAADLEAVLLSQDFCDVAFIDIRLEPNPTAGIALVKKFAGHRPVPHFVFATAQPEHALDAWELGVSDYLLKPYSPERVTRCLARITNARQRSVAPMPDRLVARKKRNLVFLDLEDIVAFEAQDRAILVHSGGEMYEVDLTLATLESTFGDHFKRVHRNWLVPLAHVRELRRDEGEMMLLVGANHLQVPVSREKAHEVRESLLTVPGIRRR